MPEPKADSERFRVNGRSWANTKIGPRTIFDQHINYPSGTNIYSVEVRVWSTDDEGPSSIWAQLWVWFNFDFGPWPKISLVPRSIGPNSFVGTISIGAEHQFGTNFSLVRLPLGSNFARIHSGPNISFGHTSVNAKTRTWRNDTRVPIWIWAQRPSFVRL